VWRGEVKGAPAEALLETYGEEFGARVRELTKRIKAVGAVICEHDVAKARERDARLLAECGGVVQDTPRQDILPALNRGWLSASGGSGRGTLFPQPRLAEGPLMDERFGQGWRRVMKAPLNPPMDLSAMPGLQIVSLDSEPGREAEGGSELRPQVTL
jgi:3-(3-hydroxy-phenyl)propionate hydroxylase